MRRLRLTTCAYGTAGSVLTIALMSTPAVAQEAPSQATVPAVSTPDAAQKPSQKSELGDIVVTARRTDERLQNVPVAVTALSQDRLIEANIVQSSDLQRVAPSLTVSTTIRGSDTPQYGIRAQRAGTPTMLIDPAVGVYFADVGTSRSGGGDAVLFDLASVQVLRGPQGTLFGRNTTGGAVLINPKLPTDRFEGYAQLKLGDYGLRDVEGAINIPLADDLALRAAVKATKRDGYFHNRLLGTDSDDIDTQSYRLSARWTPGAIESTTIATYQKSDNHGSAMKLIGIDTTALSGSTLALGPLLAADLAAQPKGFYDYNNASPGLSRQRIFGIQNTTRLDLGDGLSIKNIIGYRSYDISYCINLNGTAIRILDYCGVQNSDQFSDEFQATAKLGNLDLIAGLFYFRENGLEANQQQQLAVLAGSIPTNSPPPANVNYQDANPTNTSYSAYIHGNYDLGSLADGLSFSGGARITRDEREVTWHNRSEIRLVPNSNDRAFRCLLSEATGGAVNNPTADRSLCSYSADASFTQPTWDISANYRANPNLLLYIAHRHGYRSGGFVSSPSSVPLAQPFKPEKINDIEIGEKADFHILGGPARLNVALYYSWYDQIQRSTSQPFQLLPPPAPPTVAVTTTNASSGIIKGGEVEFTWHPTPRIELTANYALTDTHYSNFTDSYLVNGVLTRIDISDTAFTFAPRDQVTASVRYDLPVAADIGKLSISVSYYYQTSFATQDTATANCGPDGRYLNCLTYPGRLPGFSLVGLQANWKNVMGQGFDLGAFVTNLLDEKYYTYAVSQQNSFGTYAAGVGAPRMFGGSIRIPFGQ